MEEDKKKSMLKLGLLEICIIVAAVIVLFLILVFTRILPFSLPFSNLAKNLNNPYSTAPKVTYGCIFTGKLCSQGESISVPKGKLPAFYGLGFTNIPEGTAVYASIDGKIGVGTEKDTKTGEEVVSISIVNDPLHTEVDYRFAGKSVDLNTVKGGDIKKGATIGSVGSSTVTFRQNPKQFSLIFYVLDLSKKEVINVGFSDLK